MDLNRNFSPGQAYVSLSRVKNFDSLQILNFSRRSIFAHPDSIKFYQIFKESQVIFNSTSGSVPQKDFNIEKSIEFSSKPTLKDVIDENFVFSAPPIQESNPIVAKDEGIFTQFHSKPKSPVIEVDATPKPLQSNSNLKPPKIKKVFDLEEDDSEIPLSTVPYFDNKKIQIQAITDLDKTPERSKEDLFVAPKVSPSSSTTQKTNSQKTIFQYMSQNGQTSVNGNKMDAKQRNSTVQNIREKLMKIMHNLPKMEDQKLKDLMAVADQYSL